MGHPLNRALNELKGLPLGQRPQYGRVHDAGDGATWNDIEYSIFVAFQMFYATDMCLRAEETPCIILYLIKGQKVDVGKGMIMNPLQPTFHNQPIPAGHFRVSLSSVKSGMRICLLQYSMWERTTRPHRGLEAARVGCCYGRRILFVWSLPRAHQ